MIQEFMKELMRNECNDPRNMFGPAFFDQHILIVRNCACRLAEQLGADYEIVEIASYLHDIAAIRDFRAIAEHPEKGAELAENILAGERFDANKIESVKQAILTHSRPVPIGGGTPEEICLSNADAVSQILNPAYWLNYVFTARKMNFEQGMHWYFRRIHDHWNELIPAARDMIGAEYEYTLRLFRFTDLT